jgi:hypothetical protein
MYASITNRFCCIDCNYFTDYNSNVKKHFLSKKHLSNMRKENLPSKYNCLNCSKPYDSRQGLWHHNKKCKSESIPIEDVTTRLENKIDRLETIITEMSKSQQPTNNITNNNTINVNIFLNEKCGNACNLVEFIKKIDFSNENYEKLIADYVNGNAEVIERNYKQLPEFERPLYCFTEEYKEHQIAHIQHDNKWLSEPELVRYKQIKNGENETVDDEKNMIPNSLYSLVRMFDKKKLKYFDDNYKGSNLYRKCRKLESDTCNSDFLHLLIEKLITMSTINIKN